MYNHEEWIGVEVQLLTMGYGLLAYLKRTYVLWDPDKFAIAQICFVRGTHLSKRNNFRAPETAVMSSSSEEAESSILLIAFPP